MRSAARESFQNGGEFPRLQVDPGLAASPMNILPLFYFSIHRE